MLWHKGVCFLGEACNDKELIDWASDHLQGSVATGCDVTVCIDSRDRCLVKLNDLINEQLYFGCPQRIVRVDSVSPQHKGDRQKMFVTAERKGRKAS